MSGTGITTPIIGASLAQVWKPPVGVTPGAAGDATAPFALGTPAQGIVANVMKDAQFVRASAVVAAGATAGVTAGVYGATGATGNFWTNNTPFATAIGDYLFVTDTPVEG